MIPGTDQLSWYFFRVSGVLLLFLALGHMFITHYINIPSETDFDFVAARWANPLWRTFDGMLLLMALWHGLLGARLSVNDYVRSAGWRVFGNSLIWVLALVFTMYGLLTIFAFNEADARNNTGPLADDLWIATVIEVLLYAFAVMTYVGALGIGIWVVKHLLARTNPIYSGDPGQYAWILHRATGLGIVFFLLLHIFDISMISFGREVYDKSVEAYASKFLVPMEIGLVGAVIYHSLNGVRIALIDFWPMGVRKQRSLFWAALVGTFLLTLPSAVILIRAEFF